MRHSRIATRFIIAIAALVLLAGGAATRITTVASDTRTIAVGSLPWGVAVDGRSGHALVVNRTTDSSGMPAGAGTINVVDTRAGSIVRTIDVGPDPRAVAIDGTTGQAFVANDDDASVTVVDTRSGSVARTIRVGNRPQEVAIDERAGRAFVVNEGDHSVSIVDTRHNAPARTLAVPTSFDYLQDVAVDARTGHLFVGARGNGVSAVLDLDPRNGTIRHAMTVDGDLNRLAIDASTGRVFVAGSDGLSVFDARSGRLLQSFAAGSDVTSVAVDTRSGRVVLTRPGLTKADGTPLGPGSVTILAVRARGRSRAFDLVPQRSIPVGIMPDAVSVDAASGQAIVVNAGGSALVPDPWSWLPKGLRRLLPFIPPAGTTRNVPGSITVVNLH